MSNWPWAAAGAGIAWLGILVIRTRNLGRRLALVEAVLSALMNDPNLTCDHGVLRTLDCRECVADANLENEQADAS